MTDNFEAKAGKAFDDARVAAREVCDDAAFSAHNPIRRAGVGARPVPDEGRAGACTGVADAGIAAHAAASKKSRR